MIIIYLYTCLLAESSTNDVESTTIDNNSGVFTAFETKINDSNNDGDKNTLVLKTIVPSERSVNTLVCKVWIVLS